MSAADITQIILATLSLLATVAVSFFIYWLQSRHEKEIERIEAKREQKELEEKAHVFLSENSDERDYLPWAIIAANLHRHEKHSRKIYTEYCRCAPELQNEILKQAGFTFSLINGREWLEKCFNSFNEDRKKYNLGRDYLYDRAKYFHRGFERYRELPFVLDEELRTMVTTNKAYTKADFFDTTLYYSGYIDDYFRYVLGEAEKTESSLSYVPPIDLIWKEQGLSMAEEKIVCYWMMEIVDRVVSFIHNRFINPSGSPVTDNRTDAIVETYEDKYYDTLLWMYFTYCYEEPDKSHKESKMIKKVQGIKD